MATALRALNASAETILPNGMVRSLSLADLHVLPDQTPHIEIVLVPGDLITAVARPKTAGGIQRYLQLRDRASYAFANVSYRVPVTRTCRVAGGVPPS
jgi:xanthine dehydrogenase YagS FAD-binding subunit